MWVVHRRLGGSGGGGGDLRAVCHNSTTCCMLGHNAMLVPASSSLTMYDSWNEWNSTSRAYENVRMTLADMSAMCAWHGEKVLLSSTVTRSPSTGATCQPEPVKPSRTNIAKCFLSLRQSLANIPALGTSPTFWRISYAMAPKCTPRGMVFTASLLSREILQLSHVQIFSPSFQKKKQTMRYFITFSNRLKEEQKIILVERYTWYLHVIYTCPFTNQTFLHHRQRNYTEFARPLEDKILNFDGIRLPKHLALKFWPYVQ